MGQKRAFPFTFHVKQVYLKYIKIKCFMNKKLLLDNLRTVYDFPKPGIHFKDVTTLFKIPLASTK